jgi:hypothetical protein
MPLPGLEMALLLGHARTLGRPADLVRVPLAPFPMPTAGATVHCSTAAHVAMIRPDTGKAGR